MLTEAICRFIAYATMVEGEAVALLGYSDSRGDFCPLQNQAKGKRSFLISTIEVETAIASFAGASCLILAHSHEQGCIPSNFLSSGGGDVQHLGNPAWIAKVHGILKSNGIQPPLLHLIYSKKSGKWKIYRIDQGIGPWTMRKWLGKPVRLRRGWEEVSLDDTLYAA